MRATLYYLSVDGLCDDETRYRQEIAPARRVAIGRLARAAAKKRSLGAALLLSRVLGVHDDAALVYNEWGKPFLVSRGDSRLPFFSLSHTGNAALLLVSDDECGVDIETARGERAEKRSLNDGLARRFMTEEEYAAWRQDDDAASFFYRVWTAKEAVVKALGTGFAYPPSHFSVLPLPEIDGEPRVVSLEGQKLFLRATAHRDYIVTAALYNAQPLVFREVFYGH